LNFEFEDANVAESVDWFIILTGLFVFTQ